MPRKREHTDWFYERLEDQFWIDTFGKIHKLKIHPRYTFEMASIHYEIAKRIVGRKINNPQKHLENLGWIVVGSSTGSNHTLKEPTQAQLNTLIECGCRFLHILDVCRIELETMQRVDKYGTIINLKE
jgi:hypothetical protein